MSNLFLEITTVLLTAGVFSLVARVLKQPFIIAYILTGIVAGPGLLGWLQSEELFSTMSTIGISLLLFIVGLNLNWRQVKDVGFVAIAAGFAQVIFTSVVGWLLGLAVGLPSMTSAFLGVAYSFSSTIIIVKLLTDKEDIDRLYGRIAVGMLVVQDIIAMLMMLLLAAWVEGGTIEMILSVTLLKAVGTVVVLWGLAKFVVPLLFRFAARQQELLFLLALVWCFGIATALQYVGFGVEIGALMAGIALSGTGFQHEIEAKIRVLRDFFLILFFVVLGTHLTGGAVGSLWLQATVFSLYILIGNPLLAFIIMRAMGHHPRTGFLTGTTVAQISEFSFILLGTAVGAGLVIPEVLPLTTIVGLITIAGSSYLIAYNDRIFEWGARWLPFFRSPSMERGVHEEAAPEVLLIGFDRMGERILPMVQGLTKRYVVLDFNPTIVEQLGVAGVPVQYGDAGSEDALKLARAERAKMIISTVPDMAINVDLLDYLRSHGFRGSAIVTAKQSADAARAYELGATFVIVPSVLGGELFAKLLKSNKLLKTSWKKVAKDGV
jgi:Kef-type K+ transport system membrane component KefB